MRGLNDYALSQIFVDVWITFQYCKTCIQYTHHLLASYTYQVSVA